MQLGSTSILPSLFQTGTPICIALPPFLQPSLPPVLLFCTAVKDNCFRRSDDEDDGRSRHSPPNDEPAEQRQQPHLDTDMSLWGFTDMVPDNPEDPARLVLFAYCPTGITYQLEALRRPGRIAAFSLQLVDIGQATGTWDPDVIVQLRRTALMEAVMVSRYGPMVIHAALALMRHAIKLPYDEWPIAAMDLASKVVNAMYDRGARLPGSIEPDDALQLRLLLALVPLMISGRDRSHVLPTTARSIRKQIATSVSLVTIGGNGGEG